MSASLAYRPAVAGDMSFVVPTFCDNTKRNKTAGICPFDEWNETTGRHFNRILERPGVECWVAYHPGAVPGQSDLYGWLALERGHYVMRGGRLQLATKPLVIFVYVKALFRRRGIARGLLRAAGVAGSFDYAISTPSIAQLRPKLPPDAVWQDLTLRLPKYPESKNATRAETYTAHGRGDPR